MNLIGKILVGVIFVMSIVFMTLGIVVYSTQRDWKNKFQEVDGKKREMQTQNAKLQDESAKLKEEYQNLVAGLQEDVDKLRAKNNELAEENKTLSAEMGTKTQLADNANKAMTSTQENMAKLRDELVDTREKLMVAQTDLHTQFEKMVEATNTARILALDLATLKSQWEDLSKRNAEASYLLTQLGYGDLAPEVYDSSLLDVPPRVEGTITDIRPDGMVEINIGRDDGLLQGHKLHVYRDNGGVQSYLGRIEIINVKPGKAVGKIMPEYRSGNILKNDNVTAYLSQVTASL